MSADAHSHEKYAPETTRLLNQYNCVDSWRYECVGEDCESTSIAVRRKLGDHKQHSEYTPHGTKHPKVHVHDYRCTQCGEEFDQPYDKIHERVGPVEGFQ